MPFTYDESGYVADWGPPNVLYLGDHGYVPGWEMWQVKIWWKYRHILGTNALSSMLRILKVFCSTGTLIFLARKDILTALYSS